MVANIKSKSIIIKECADKHDSLNIISIPKVLLEKSNNVELEESKILKVGCSEYKVETIVNDTDNCIEIPRSLMKDLGLYNGLKSNAYVENGKLNIGPVVAVFTSMSLIRNAKKQKLSNNIKRYLKANETAQCILYFFCVHDVDFYKQRINGVIYNKAESKWEIGSLPLPNVLYDRGGSRYKYLNVSNSIRRELEKIDEIKKVNAQSFFDKLHLYEVLSKYPAMKTHLPLTKDYSKEGLKELFKVSKTVYIKARLGSNGKSVMRVEEITDKLYKYSTARNEIVTGTAYSLDELVEEITKFFKNRELLIQAEINLLKIDNCLVDMRATVQRDYRGELGITTCVVRLAQKDSPVTSTASGSNVYSFEEFFKYVMEYSDNEIFRIKTDVETFLINTYKYLEDSYGAFGEIGIDLGIDDEGELWFIESNSKPAKTTIHLLKNNDLIMQSYLKPLEYAKYLASFY